MVRSTGSARGGGVRLPDPACLIHIAWCLPPIRDRTSPKQTAVALPSDPGQYTTSTAADISYSDTICSTSERFFRSDNQNFQLKLRGNHFGLELEFMTSFVDAVRDPYPQPSVPGWQWHVPRTNHVSNKALPLLSRHWTAIRDSRALPSSSLTRPTPLRRVHPALDEVSTGAHL